MEESAAPPSPDFRALFESAPGCYLVFDREFVIVAASNAYLQATRTRREALLGRSAFESVPTGVDAGELRASLQRIQETGAGDTMPIRKTRAAEDGGMRSWRFTNSPVLAGDGTLAYIIHRFEDVTELVELEQREAAANEAAQRSLDDAQRFAYLAAHDLQSPLNAISGCVRLLREDCEGKLSEQGEKFMGYVVEYTQRAQTLIQDLLTYSRLETRAQPFEPTDLNRVLADALHFTAKRIEDRGAQVGSGTMPTLAVDRTQITLLLANLIDNAVKFNDAPRPEVQIEANRVGDEWVFSVRDNGIGIEPRFHDEIFEIFRRLHSAQAYPGSGVGLAICHRVVTRHGGRIWVESQEGKGSTFFFTLPAEKTCGG